MRLVYVLLLGKCGFKREDLEPLSRGSLFVSFSIENLVQRAMCTLVSAMRLGGIGVGFRTALEYFKVDLDFP